MLQEDDDAREAVLESLLRDGLKLKFNLKFIRVESRERREGDSFPLIRVVVEEDGEEKVDISIPLSLGLCLQADYTCLYTCLR